MKLVHSLLLLGLVAASAPTIGKPDTTADLRAAVETSISATTALLSLPAYPGMESEEDDTSPADPRETCALATVDPTHNEGLPKGLLAAIALTESAFNPYAVGTQKRAYHPETESEALGIARKYGRRAAVGCMQIHMRWHPYSARELIDPYFNVSAASAYLIDLKDRTGDWSSAVGAYHGGDNRTRADYVCRVKARLRVVGGDPGALPVKCSKTRMAADMETARKHLSSLKTTIVNGAGT